MHPQLGFCHLLRQLAFSLKLFETSVFCRLADCVYLAFYLVHAETVELVNLKVRVRYHHRRLITIGRNRLRRYFGFLGGLVVLALDWLLLLVGFLRVFGLVGLVVEDDVSDPIFRIQVPALVCIPGKLVLAALGSVRLDVGVDGVLRGSIVGL